MPAASVCAHGDTYLILATAAHMARQFQPDTVERLTERTTPYLYVRSLDEALSRLPASAPSSSGR